MNGSRVYWAETAWFFSLFDKEKSEEGWVFFWKGGGGVGDLVVLVGLVI